jgi:hypothetical protein
VRCSATRCPPRRRTSWPSALAATTTALCSTATSRASWYKVATPSALAMQGAPSGHQVRQRVQGVPQGWLLAWFFSRLIACLLCLLFDIYSLIRTRTNPRLLIYYWNWLVGSTLCRGQQRTQRQRQPVLHHLHQATILKNIEQSHSKNVHVWNDSFRLTTTTIFQLCGFDGVMYG